MRPLKSLSRTENKNTMVTIAETAKKTGNTMENVAQ